MKWYFEYALWYVIVYVALLLFRTSSYSLEERLLVNIFIAFLVSGLSYFAYKEGTRPKEEKTKQTLKTWHWVAIALILIIILLLFTYLLILLL